MIEGSTPIDAVPPAAHVLLHYPEAARQFGVLKWYVTHTHHTHNHHHHHHHQTSPPHTPSPSPPPNLTTTHHRTHQPHHHHTTKVLVDGVRTFQQESETDRRQQSLSHGKFGKCANSRCRSCVFCEVRAVTVLHEPQHY